MDYVQITEIIDNKSESVFPQIFRKFSWNLITKIPVISINNLSNAINSTCFEIKYMI